MRSNESSFVWSDAWVLLSLIYAKGRATREELRRMGDFINHAIFTDEELVGGLNRLKVAGHLTEENDRFEPTPPVLDWYEKAAPSKRRSVHKDMERVMRFLRIPTGRE